MMHMRPFGRFIAVSVICALPLLVACGETSIDTSDSTPTPAVTATSTGAIATATSAPVATATVPPAATATATATIPPTVTRTATPSCPDYVDLNDTLPATFTASGSVEQVYVIDAVAGTALDLVDEQGCIVQSGTADTAGSLLFRNVAAGEGYRVVSVSDTAVIASQPLTVTTADQVPDPSFYSSQQLTPGFGYLTTRDGIKLSINVLLPGAPDAGPYPTVIEYSGYDPSNPYAPEPSTLISAALGYAVVGINIRGTGCSGGAFDFYETLQSTDGYDAIEIVAAQPWVKGNKVGMVGVSYPAISQLFAAQFQPPHLAAIAPLSVIASTGSVLFPGGILNNGFATDWAQERQQNAEPYPSGQGWIRRRIEQDNDQVCLENQNLRLQASDLMQKIRDNPFYTDEVAAPVSPETFVGNINVPVFLAGGWQDEQTGPYFATMLDKFAGTDKVHFTVVNGNHTEPLIPAIVSRWMEFLSLYVREEIPSRPPTTNVILTVILSDAFGIENSGIMLEPERYTGVSTYAEALAQWEAEPKVRVLFESGAGGAPGYPLPTAEASFDAWPIPSVEPTVWYLDADGKLSTAVPATDGADSFLYDTSRAQETSFSGGTSDVWVALPAWHWQPLPVGKAAAYVSDPLTETLVMAGSGSIDLWLESTASDTDIQVTLSEVRPDGQESYVQTGWLRASRRQLNEAVSTDLRPVQTHREEDAAPLPAGQLSEVRVELYPFGHVFRAGSRLKIAISAPGGDRPHWKFEALPAVGTVTNTIARGPAAPSRVVLPVVPDVEVPEALPPCPSLRGQPCRTYVEYVNTPAEE
jgi:predicted acyl esterase